MSMRSVSMACLLTVLAGSAWGAERIGSTVAADSTVSGSGAVGDRMIATADPIYQDERLRSNQTGLGQFELRDGTRLVLGRNAVITVDKYVTGNGNLAKTIALKAAAGSFRFITGASDHSAYLLKTPQGTIGVRGTAFDASMTPSGTNLLLLSGSLTFCNNAGQCKVLDKPCDYIVANADGTLGPAQTATQAAPTDELQNIFPIAANESRLQSGFREDRASACVGIATLKADVTDTTRALSGSGN
jgi:hypothetical protein